MAFYDDASFGYDKYWQGREYEHRSELFALKKLLGENAGVAADVGGGFGRLSKWLTKRSRAVYLIEPSAKMRSMAEKYLADAKNVIIRPGTAQKTGLKADSVDTAIIVRVLHHLPNPEPALLELKRIVKPGGRVVVEFANSTHFLARVRSLFLLRPILPGAIDRRSKKNITTGTIDFVNHHPLTVRKMLKRLGFVHETTLSVSNLRHPVIKKLVPMSILLGLESIMQTLLAGLCFGPSIFMLVRVDK